jgi:hypothetical protein
MLTRACQKLLSANNLVRPAVVLFAVVLAGPTLAAGQATAPVEFNRDIRPILSDKCFACHGFDPKTRKAGLRLDTLEGATVGKDGKPGAVVPGDVPKSELWARITSSDPDELMPPAESHKTLSDAEKDTFKRWIEQGAKYQKHWSFEPIVRPAVPQPAAAAQVRNAVDAFLLARLEREGLAAGAEADRSTLIRRVAFALTGLPPTPAEVEVFVNDQGPEAYERMVDRYLASPRFGEEMARHWLDVARYGDTHGLHLDNERQMWAYRDYVVKSFNDNKRFDVFTIEQLAGDMLPEAGTSAPTKEQLTATGFSRCNVTTSEGGSIDAELTFRYAVDRTDTTMTTWMGLTGGCAVCHDHKFDPISAKEFYSMYAFFYSNADPAMDGNALLTNPVTKLPTPEQEKRLAEFGVQIAAKQKELDERTAALAYVDPATVTPAPAPQVLETVWIDDEFPAGAAVQSSGAPTQFVTTAEGGQVLSGSRAIKRTDAGLAQDFYQGGAAAPLEILPSGTIFAHVFLDPANLPKSIMVQFHKGDWKHRAVWGEYDPIPFGAPNTTEKVHFGALPEAGKWVRLEIPIERVGLVAGEPITGVAVTQYGGTVYWDKVGIAGRTDPAGDPTRSMLAWQKSRAGQDTPGVPGDVNQLLKDGPEKATNPEQVKRLRDYYLQNVCADTKAQLATLPGELAALRQQRTDFDNSIPSTFVFTDLAAPRDAFVMVRGGYDKPGEKVAPGTLAILPPLQKADPNGRATRLDLAKWLVAPEHPLTARVAANRLWQQFFGTGLVKTSADFGSQGEVPSHPELLDWLAAEFREGGWDQKRMVKLLVTSGAFRRSAVVTPELLDRDPENRLLARGPRFRLDAEQIRDNALFVSGLINLEMGGKGVRTYQPPNIWEPVGFVGSNTREYKQDTGPALYRRSLYVFLKRTAPAPFMSNFDAPNRESTCARRERSNTPLQALQLMNDVQHVEAARAMAQRMLSEGGTTPAERIAFAYRAVLARQPEAFEAEVVRAQLDTHLARYAADAEAAKKVISHGESEPKAGLPPAELAAYTLVANMILNLDETVTRN